LKARRLAVALLLAGVTSLVCSQMASAWLAPGPLARGSKHCRPGGAGGRARGCHHGPRPRIGISARIALVSPRRGGKSRGGSGEGAGGPASGPEQTAGAAPASASGPPPHEPGGEEPPEEEGGENEQGEEEPPPEEPAPPPVPCTTVVSSIGEVKSAVTAAAPGDGVCLADGTYGELSLTASKTGQVTVEAEHPGLATIDGATLGGSHLTLTRFHVSNEVEVKEGASSIAIEHNRIEGGWFAIDTCYGSSHSEPCSDERVVGNQLFGPYGEDAIRVNRPHDADGDGIGLLVEGNEIKGVRENGEHSDCLQSVWAGDHLIFRRNYEHDNRCQGVFIKDQDFSIEGVRLEDNLIVRNHEPPAPSCPECGQPNTLNLYGPYTQFTMSHNTIWTDEPTAAFRTAPPAGTMIDSNVVYRLEASSGAAAATFTNNSYCELGGSWPTGAGNEGQCSPPFQNPSVDDYRLANGRGVDWAPAEEHYGP
jgi:hypothetical protein